MMVVMKLIAPRIEDAPAKCKEKMAKSTEGPLCACTLDKGGYTVHPVPAPASTREDASKRHNEGGNNQNEMLFLRGKALSTDPNLMGTNTFPKPPILVGLTKKKILMKACPVTKELYN
jgi:hypothetical protein